MVELGHLVVVQDGRAEVVLEGGEDVGEVLGWEVRFALFVGLAFWVSFEHVVQLFVDFDD